MKRLDKKLHEIKEPSIIGPIDLSFISQQPVMLVTEFTAGRAWIEKRLKMGRLKAGDSFVLRIIKPGGEIQTNLAVVHSIVDDRITVRLCQGGKIERP